MDSEEKYSDISRKLKDLEPVKASDNFVHNLHLKIVELEAEKRHEHEKRYDEKGGGFLRNLFGNMQNPWLIPAAGFTVLIFFVFYITFINKSTSDKDAQVSSNQKQETSEQKDPLSDQNKALPTNTDSSLKGKENLPGKDIAGDLKTDKEKSSPSPVENTRQFSDRNDLKNGKYKLKVTELVKVDEQVESNDADVQNFTKKESEINDTGNNGLVTSEPQKDESLSTAESRAYNDTAGTYKGKVNEYDQLMKKLDEKLRRINKTDLERIREEIIK